MRRVALAASSSSVALGLVAALAIFTAPGAVAGCSSDSPASGGDAGAGDDAAGGDAAACTIAVAPSGDDAKCSASGGSPCKTLTKALSLATGACAVTVAAGSYGAGETFPLAIKDGVHVTGAGDATVIDAAAGTIGGDAITVSCPGISDAQKRAVVTMAGASSLVSVKLKGAQGAADLVTVLVTGGDVEIGKTSIEGGQDGVYVTGTAKANLHDLVTTGQDGSGLTVAGTSTATIANVKASAAKNGLTIACGATATVDKSEAFCDGDGISISGQAHVTVTGSNLHHDTIGIATKGATTDLTATGNQIVKNKFGIVSVQAPLLLGNNTTPGNNTIVNGEAGLYLDRVAADIIALGDTWVPNVQQADAQGHYALASSDGKYTAAALYCPKTPYGTVDNAAPDGCVGDEDVPVDAAKYQNFVIDEPKTCSAGAAVDTGTLTLASR